MPPRAKPIEAPEEIGPAWTDRLIGHAEAEQGFLKAHESGRMPHAWLISGPKGVGKATLAYRMARFLLAQPAEEDGGMFGGLAAPVSTSMQCRPKRACSARLPRRRIRISGCWSARSIRKPASCAARSSSTMCAR
jgi:DNA polymerase-3 subunit delta'